ncbi:MAG: hypothetical protein ABIJ56_00375 [Pseudomonadota bacterium]
MSRNWEKIQINDRIGEKYLVKRRLVPGGGGPVYAGIDLKTKKVVQVRFFSDDEILDDISLRYRVEETEKVQEMCGDVVTIPVDYGFFKEVPYIVHKFGDIKTLHQVLMAGKMMGGNAARPLIGTLLTMLGEIHNGGVVHLGLSPLSIYQRQSSNNLIAPGVLDFGLVPFRGHSYFSYPGSVDNIFNTISSYASPEQASYDEIVDHRADLFSVGVLVYRLVLGETPFKGSSTEEILGKVVSETPSSLFDDSDRMSKGIRDFLFRALQKEPRDRFQSASEMLESFLDSFGEEDGKQVEGASSDVVEYDEDLPTGRIDVAPVVMSTVRPIEPQEPAERPAEAGPPAAPKGAYGHVKLSSKSIRSALYKANPMQEEVLPAGKKEARAASGKDVKMQPRAPSAEKGAPGPAAPKRAEQAPPEAERVEAAPRKQAPQQPPPPPASSKPRPREPVAVEAPPEQVMPIESAREKAVPPDPSRQRAAPVQAAEAQALPAAPPAPDDAALAEAVDRGMQRSKQYEREETGQPAVSGDRGADLLAGLDDFDVEVQEPPPPRPPPPAPGGASPDAAAGKEKSTGGREMEMEYHGEMEELDLGMELMNAKSPKKGQKPREKPRINPKVKKLLREKEKVNLPPSIAFEREDAAEEPKSLKDRLKGFMKKKK